MFINKLNQLYKPQRILYYMDVTQEELRSFCKGEAPERILPYSDAFGTYDHPGMFFLEGFDDPVIGIEFRPADERITYPEGLKTVSLEGAFYYSVEIDKETGIDRRYITDLFEKISSDNDARRGLTDLSVDAPPAVIGVFIESKKIRILYECRVVSDRAKHIMADEAECFTPDYLYKSAFTDWITGHYNWNHLVSYLEMPGDAGINDYAFVHFDIKEFRVINEVYGHISANKVLCNVVNAMKEAPFVYASARCHNDNFAMMIRDMSWEETYDTLNDFFEKLSRLEDDPNYRICFRCGVVPMQRAMLYGNRVADAGKLAQALGTGRNGTEIIMYSDKMHDDISWANYIKAYVQTAIEQDEFVVYLQPKFDIAKETIKGSEALIRWNYKNKEFLPPSRFIPFFEKDGSIGRIDDVVLTKVCAFLAECAKQGKALYPVSVNLSRNRMFDADLIDHLVSIVDSYGVDHNLIDFELTESATYDDTEHMLGILEELRKKGFKISMDDFGTGYSSLSLLTKMPIDTLKIDKSFVDTVASEEERKEDIIVLHHIITLARELGFVCLAEGAEKKEQVGRLRELGCEIIQGYYYGKPIAMGEFKERYLD